MTPISRIRLVFIVLALFAVLTVAPLASAQTDPLPMPDNFPTLGQMADRGTRNPSADLMATAVFANGGDANANVLVEGGAPVAVNITLNAQPTTPVTLTYGMNESINLNNVSVYPKKITFTPENWDTPQTVEIHALENYRTNNYRLGLDGLLLYIGTIYGYVYEQTAADGTYLYGAVNFGGGFFDPFIVIVRDNPTPPAAPTGPLVVTTLADSYSTLIEGSLRQMLLIADSRNLPSQTITFQEGLNGTINLAADMPELTRSITVVGPGQDLLTIDGGEQFVGLTGSTMTVQDLTLANLMMAVYASDLTLTDVTVRDSGPGARMLYQSGAVFAGKVTVTRSTFTGNEGVLSGALTIVEDQYTITDSLFTDNHALPVQLVPGSPMFGEGGGAIYILTESGIESGSISNSTFSDNSGSAGAIFSNVNWSGATQIITDSTFANNTGESVGAIWAYDSSHLVVFNSTFANNTGKSVGAITIEDDAFVDVYNSTFSANAALSPTGTAAIYHPEGMPGANTAVSQIIFSTFSGHNAGEGSGGVLNGNIVFFASVIANNSAPNPLECLNGAGGNDYLVFSADLACGSYTEIVTIPLGVDPVLRDNGGSTMTHALLPGSNVIDSDTPRGEDGSTVCSQRQEGEFATDQRGVERPQFQYCDYGAFESNLLTLPPVNRSVNGSFEAAGATFNDADGWTGRNLNPDDYRRCDSALTPVAVQNGACAFMFRGPNANTEPRRLTQTLEGGGWSRAGKVLRLSAQVRTKNLGAGGRLAINVVYRDGTTGTALVRIPAGTNPYQRVMVRLPLAKRADSVTITVRLKTGGNQNTRLWVDNVVLVSQ